jgi:hypothetical protein
MTISGAMKPRYSNRTTVFVLLTTVNDVALIVRASSALHTSVLRAACCYCIWREFQSDWQANTVCILSCTACSRFDVYGYNTIYYYNTLLTCSTVVTNASLKPFTVRMHASSITNKQIQLNQCSTYKQCALLSTNIDLFNSYHLCCLKLYA